MTLNEGRLNRVLARVHVFFAKVRRGVRHEATAVNKIVVWIEKFTIKQIKAIWRHPHHYATALGCTVLMLAFGHYEAAGISGFWLYALCENIFGDE